MQNQSREQQVFVMAVKHARSNDPEHRAHLGPVLFFLSAASRQHQGRREYELAALYKRVYFLLRAAGSIGAAWKELELLSAHESGSDRQTPVSNTGVTETGAAVPTEYFTGGK